jgi:hypothetical protein
MIGSERWEYRIEQRMISGEWSFLRMVDQEKAGDELARIRSSYSSDAFRLVKVTIITEVVE